MKICVLFILYLLCICPSILWADMARLIGSGNLYLVTTDETTIINPYNLGNPAGLSLLPPQFQLSENAGFTSWGETGSFNEYVLFLSPTYAQFPSLGLTNNTYNLVENNNVNAVINQQYQGLIDVTPDHWAFQLSGGAGDGFDSEIGSMPDYNLFEGSEFVEIAHNWGPIAFGTSLLAVQNDNHLFVLDTNTQVLSNSGFLVNLPLDSKPQGTRFRIGGTFQFNLQPENDQSTVNGNNTSTETTTWNYEPSIYFEVPGSLEAALLCDFNDQTISQVTNKNNPSHEYNNTFNLTALCKWKVPVDKNDVQQPLTWNSGFDLDYSNFQSTADTFFSQATTFFQAQVGVGLEREKDFTAGLQTVFEAQNQTSIQSGTFGWTNNPTNFSITGGGEKWLGPQWAVRLGLTYFYDEDPIGSEVVNFIPVGTGQTLSGWMINGGCGYQSNNLKIDLASWYESPGTVQSLGSYSPLNPQGSVTPYTAWGIQISFAYYFSVLSH